MCDLSYWLQVQQLEQRALHLMVASSTQRALGADVPIVNPVELRDQFDADLFGTDDREDDPQFRLRRVLGLTE